MQSQFPRRSFLRQSATQITALAAAATPAIAQTHSFSRDCSSATAVVGSTTDPRIDFHVFPNGNAVDSAVATALIAAVKAPSQTGIGGYGLSAIVAAQDGNRIVAIDANSAAPQSMPADIFKPGPDGTVKDRINDSGWLAAGVPGVLAGLQALIDHFCSTGFNELVQPAIQIAQHGFPWPETLAKTTNSRPVFRKDPGSQQLYLPGGSPIPPGEIFRNPDLANLLQHLAAKNRVDDFYKGSIATQIAAAFAKNGGLVTAADLANYSANLVTPLALTIDDLTVHTPPLTAGGLTVLQMLHAEHFLAQTTGLAPEERLHAAVEIMRIAWHDRLCLLGDPAAAANSEVPLTRLLSANYARESAAAATTAARKKQILNHPIKPKQHSGTIHISAADNSGLTIALTLTHGNGFGAGVTVPGLGLTLGHGMSRFETNPEHPNAPGPAKRPLHNMVPAIVTHHHRTQFALGGAGGRRIPNTVYSILRAALILKQPLSQALQSVRFHTEGNQTLQISANTPEQTRNYLNQIGYQTASSPSAAIASIAPPPH